MVLNACALVCSVESLKQKLAKETAMHKQDRARLLRENTALTKEVSTLRKDVRFMEQAAACQERGIALSAEDLAPPATTVTRTTALRGVLDTTVQPSRPSTKSSTARHRSARARLSARSATSGVGEGARREIEMQRRQILQLRERLAKLRKVVESELGPSVANGTITAEELLRDMSRDKLRPVRPPSSKGPVPDTPSAQGLQYTDENLNHSQGLAMSASLIPDGQVNDARVGE